jgi:Domain of unknown function (DUF4124)
MMNRFPRKGCRRLWMPVAGVVLWPLFALVGPAGAAEPTPQIFKCTDGSGNVTYQNEPCPKDSKASGRIDIFDNRWSANREEREAEWTRNAADHRVVAGMPARWVRDALGEPTEIRDTPTAGAAQLWLYDLPDRSIEIGMLNDQVLWFRETPTGSTRATPAERPATGSSAPRVASIAPGVDRPANLPVVKPTPSASTDAPRVAPAQPVASKADSASVTAPAPEAPTAPSKADSPSVTSAATDVGAGSATSMTKPAGPRSVARGQDCKQALAGLGPPTRQRDVPALDAGSDSATEYFYESAGDAGRLRVVCSNGKVEGVDRSVTR